MLFNSQRLKIYNQMKLFLTFQIFLLTNECPFACIYQKPHENVQKILYANFNDYA